MDNRIGIVFIHGAGLNSSLWDAMKGKIHYPILAIDFPNRNPAKNSNAKLTFTSYVNKAVTEIKNWQKNNFIIVAHSIGACVGLKIAEEFKNELRGFVAISSVIPENGQSFVSSFPFPQNLLLPVLMTLFGTKPPDQAIEKELCNDITPDKTSKIVKDFTPEGKALYTTKINYDLPEIKRLYIKLTNDKAIPVDLQNKMAANLQATKIETLVSGHLPMLSNAEELALILSDFVNEIIQD